MFSNKILLSLISAFLCVSVSFAVEIPLRGTIKRAKTENTIVFVDMDKVFKSHPMSERLKAEIKNFAQTRKTAIEEMISRTKKISEQIKEINLKIIQAQEAEDSAALSELAANLDSAQKDLEEQKAKIADLSKRTKEELVRMEERHSLAVLKDIDTVLKEVSRKHGSEVMFDKQNILYGGDSCEDVTDEVIKKLEGR